MRLEASSDHSLSSGEPSEGGHCDHRHVAAVLWAERTNISQKFKTIPFRQSYIRENNIRTVLSDCLHSLGSIWTDKDFGSVSSEKMCDAIQSVRVVFYDDDRNTAKDSGGGHISRTQNSTTISVKLANWYQYGERAETLGA